MNFIGEKCAACGIVIKEDDSVIVCPDCGSPHHRECYLNYGNCANESYHASGKKWKRAAVEPKISTVTCKICGFQNPANTKYCSQCGTELNLNENMADSTADNTANGETASSTDEVFSNMFAGGKPYLGFDPEEDLGGATVKEVSDFVSSNTMYYLPIFKNMKDFGSKLSFNITCLFFPSLYFANRKMWSWAIIAVILSIILTVPSGLLYIADYAENGMEGISKPLLAMINSNSEYLIKTDKIFSIIQLCLNFVFCFFGNRMYFKYIVHSVKKIKKHEGSSAALQLGNVGGVKPINMLFVILIKFFLTFFTFNFIDTFLC